MSFFFQIHKIQLEQTHSISIELNTFKIDMYRENCIVLNKNRANQQYISVLDKFTGKVIREIPSGCNHFYRMACQHPTVVSLVIESCQECEEIRAYDIRTLTKRVVRKHLKPLALCLGPGKSLLFVTVDGTILELEWINEVEGFAIVRNIQVTIKPKKITKMCYLEQHNVLVVLSKGLLHAVHLEDGCPLWKLSKTNKGSRFEPSGVTCDTAGRVFVVESCDRWLLVLDGLTGERLQVVRLQECWALVNDVCWSPTQPQLTVLHDVNMISCYNML